MVCNGVTLRPATTLPFEAFAAERYTYGEIERMRIEVFLLDVLKCSA